MNPSRIWLEREIAAFAAGLAPGSRVLDAGSGDQRYRDLFAACTYESADFEKVDKPYRASTYVCDLSAIPTPSEHFDALIFTQVMEHLPEPALVLAEFHRILKPGGRLFFTGPLLYEEHEQPYDFYRYTQFGVRHLLEAAGFTIERLSWLEGFLGTLHYLLRRISRSIPLSPRRLGGGGRAWLFVGLAAVLKPAMSLAASLAGRLDVRHRYVDGGFPINYLAIARKTK